MSSGVIALLVFVVIFGGAMFGMHLKSVLPENHMSPDSKDVVKLSIGLIATMTALVLGLLVSSVKSSFDDKNNQYNRICADLVLLDRLLAQYGPETGMPRAALKLGVTTRAEQVVERKSGRVTKEDAYVAMVSLEKIEAMIRGLKPADEAQKELKERAQAVAAQIVSARWHLLGGVASAVPTPFLVIVIIWLGIIFLSFGLYAPRNGTVVASLLMASISVAGALFLIMEMNRPFEGMIHISTLPLQNAAQYIGQ